MTEEVRKYAEKCIIESGIRMVPGHYPEFGSKEQVDMFIQMSAEIGKRAHIKVDVDKYRALLELLKKNKENVPLELLTTKYRKSYGELKESIRAMTKDILQDVVFDGLRIERSQADQKYVEINTAIQKSGILGKASHAAFSQYSAEQVLEYVFQLRDMVHRIVKGSEESGS